MHLLATMILAWPALTGQLLLNARSDQYKAGYAFRDFARQYFAEHGAIPQWNPWLFGGMPFVDAMHGDTFYPTALLRLLLGTGPGMTWGLVIHLFLAGIFTYLLLRTLRLSFHSAMLGGVAYQMSGNIAGLVSPGHDGKIFVAALLPLALWLLVRGIRDHRGWAWGPLALVVGLAVLSPHPQLLQYMLLLCGACALFLWRGWGTGPEDLPGTRHPGRLGLALTAIAIGMLIGAIQFWPVVTYTPWSPRNGGLGWEHAVSFSLPPEELINFALPEFTGMLDAYWGRNRIHLHSEYIGIAVLLLAAMAFGNWAQGPLRRWRWFFAGSFVVSLLWALGGNTPFYQLVYAIVPGTKFFRAPSTMLFIVNFTLACLAAFGAERVLRGSLPRPALWGAGGTVALLGLFAISGGLTNTGLSLAAPEAAQGVIANEPALQAGAIRMLAFAALMVVAVVLVAGKRLSRDLAGALLIGIVAVDLWSILRRYFMFMPPAAATFATDDAIAWLQKQPGPFRVIPLPPRQGTEHDQYLQALNYDGLMTHRVAVAMGYHGNHIGKYDLLLGSDYAQLGNPNFWRLANTRYFLTDEPTLPIDSARTVFGPATNVHGRKVWVHQVPVQTSYAWTTTALLKADEQQAAQTVLNPGFDVQTVAIFDTSARVDAAELRAVPPPSRVAARTTAWAPGQATIELDAPAPAGSALVVSENYYPGWQARVDGQAVAVHRANVSLVGIALPAGARKIELEFVNAPYATGRLVTWLAIACSLAWWVVGWRRRPEVTTA
ncbi:MAG: YfhO family protein [Gemmatimonadetes bacterium]|nr:YfhO family protein [Gemmatimonadota bacterium]